MFYFQKRYCLTDNSKLKYKCYMQSLLKRIHRRISLRQYETRVFHSAKKYLIKGLYYFSFQQKQIIHTSFFDLFSRKFLHIHSVLKNNKQKNISIKFDSGLGKTVLLLEDFVVCISRNKKQYNFIKHNYCNYSEDFVYPYAKILSFNDRELTFIMEKAKGINHQDNVHDKIIIKKLIDYSIKSPFIVDDYKMYIQHVDVTRNNVFFQSDDEIKFIDIDNISYKPVFFDIIHFASHYYDANELLNFLLENDDLLTKALSKFGYNGKNIFKKLDIVFSEYIRYYKNYMPKLSNDYLFLSSLDNSKFPLVSKQFVISNK